MNKSIKKVKYFSGEHKHFYLDWSSVIAVNVQQTESWDGESNFTPKIEITIHCQLQEDPFRTILHSWNIAEGYQMELLSELMNDDKVIAKPAWDAAAKNVLAHLLGEWGKYK